MPKFSEEEKALLAQYVSDPDTDVFSVFPKLQGIVGAAYARYSRAKGGFREILLQEFLKTGVLDQKHAENLVEKILNSYGDDSVGELEGAHLSFEEVSNLATKEIEDRRIGGSPIEQSTRYVFYDQRDEQGRYRYLRVPEIMESNFAVQFETGMDFIFDTYSRLIEPMQGYFRTLKLQDEAWYDIRGDKNPVRLADLQDEREIRAWKITYNSDIRTKACDTLRVLLPACTKTNVGLFGNGRYHQYLLTCLYSHSLWEMKKLAADGHKALNSIIPVHVKRAGINEYMMENDLQMDELVRTILEKVKPLPSEEGPILLEKEDLETETLALMLYKYAEHPLPQLFKIVRKMNSHVRRQVFDTYIGSRISRRDRPGRALEAGYPIVFDCVGDFGIYRDLHRERMKTQMRQFLTTRLGHVMPVEFEFAGVKDQVAECFKRSGELYELFRKRLGRQVAQYVVLFGHNIRWYQGENYREALHEIELRTGKQGHPSYRKMCQQMYYLLKKRDPLLIQMFNHVDLEDHYWSRAESEAKQRVKESKFDNQ